MSDPIMLSVASALAAKGAEAALDGAKSAWSSLARVVRKRCASDTAAAAALDTAMSDPRDSAHMQALAQALERIAEADPEFRAQVHALWPSASAELSARDGGVINSVSGSVGGHVIQARDLHVEGGLHLGDVHRPGGHT